MKIVRMHNVEHTYYLNLAFSTNKIINKVFFLLESLKLRFFENRLSFAQYILSISPGENNYFNRKFGNSILVPPFHPFEEPKGIKGKGRYILLHGNLSVPDNIRSTLYIIGKLDKKVDFPIIIAGKNPTREIIQLGTKNSNITVISSPGIEEMHSLIRNSHIIILHTYQQTGSKLKLLDSIYLGRFVIANSLMLNDTGMESFCEKADTPDELIEKINQMLEKTFNDDLFSQRGALFTKFSNKKNAETITKLILNHPDDVP